MAGINQMLTSKQVAEVLRRDRSTVLRQAKSGLLPVAFTAPGGARGDSFYFDPAEIAKIARQEIDTRRAALATIDAMSGGAA